MAINLEFKSKIDSFENIKKTLLDIGADFCETLNQKDIYYRVKNGLLKLRIENGIYSLIRYNRDEYNPDRWSNYFVIKLDGKETNLLLESLFEIEYRFDNSAVIKKFKHKVKWWFDKENNSWYTDTPLPKEFAKSKSRTIKLSPHSH